MKQHIKLFLLLLSLFMLCPFHIKATTLIADLCGHEDATSLNDVLEIAGNSDTILLNANQPFKGYDNENYELSLTVTPYVPGISLSKSIGNNTNSAQWPGTLVALGKTMNISYVVTNTSQVTLNNIVVSDNQGYVITQPKTTLAPGESMTCTATAPAPDLNKIHTDIATVTAIMGNATAVSATSTAYALSVPTGSYRLNWGCLCSDITNSRHTFIGSRNLQTSLDPVALSGYMLGATFNPTNTTIQAIFNEQTLPVINSAVYNTENEINIAILGYSDNAYITLATVQNNAFQQQHTTKLSSMAFKVQWFADSQGTIYLATDEQDALSLYTVDLTLYTLSLVATASNLAFGMPSIFLYWLIQDSGIYLVQGYNNNTVATYKVTLDTPTIYSGVTTDLHVTFSTINACSTGANYLALAGTNTNGNASLTRYIVNGSGYVEPILSKTISGATTVNYCEKCCCSANDELLVGTDNGLFSLNATSLNTVASYAGSNWVNVCWCCSQDKIYCSATSSNQSTYLFKEEGDSLIRL